MGIEHVRIRTAAFRLSAKRSISTRRHLRQVQLIRSNKATWEHESMASRASPEYFHPFGIRSIPCLRHPDQFFQRTYGDLIRIRTEIPSTGSMAPNALPYYTSYERYFGASANSIRDGAQP